MTKLLDELDAVLSQSEADRPMLACYFAERLEGQMAVNSIAQTTIDYCLLQSLYLGHVVHQ